MKNLIIFISITLISCSHISFVTKQKDIEFGKRIINNVDSLLIILNDTNLVSFGFHLTSRNTNSRFIQKLIEHLKINHFKDGFEFDKELIEQIEYNSKSIIVHKIRFRSKLTNDIIWFYFNNYPESDKWLLSFYEFCNNPEATVPGINEPCDKK
ncbi:MAG: hypothetical protein NT007_17500 [Candidatus Kapabacteria bacterium]|nr:hypothetical protein [Candidatus Kapabacteria bacterium]